MRPELRNTRRGWTVFSAAPTGGSGGGSQAPADQAAAVAAEKARQDAAAASTPVDYKTLLVTLLDLDPATADDTAIKTAFDAREAAQVDIVALQTKASSADTLQQQYDALQAQYQELNKKQEEIWKAKQEAEADEILLVYKDRFVDDAAMAPIRQILITDKESGIAILNSLKKLEAAASSGTETKVDGEPPSPKHDPGAANNPTADEKIAEQNALIKKIQSEGKFTDYTAARDEARRQKPELFS